MGHDKSAEYNNEYVDGKQQLNIQEDPILTSTRNANKIANNLGGMLPTDIKMPVIVKMLQDSTRKDIIDEIVGSVKSIPSKLPTVGTVVPISWLCVHAFVFAVRDHGFPINATSEKRDTFVDYLLKKLRKLRIPTKTWVAIISKKYPC